MISKEYIMDVFEFLKRSSKGKPKATKLAAGLTLFRNEVVKECMDMAKHTFDPFTPNDISTDQTNIANLIHQNIGKLLLKV